MKIRRIELLSLVLLPSLIIVFGIQTAQASSIPLGHKSWVTLTRNITVYKVKRTFPLSSSYSVGTYKAKKGSHYRLLHSGVNFEWSLASGNFNSNSFYTYAILNKGSRWFKLGIHKSALQGMKVAKTNDFFYKKYTPAYLQADYGPQKLYTSSENAQKKRGAHITVKSIYKKYYARWDDGNNSNVLRIRLNSETYYINGNGEFQPYNSWKYRKIINSPYSPHSSSKIVLRHGDKYEKINYWDKVVPYHKGTLVTKSWRFRNDKWVK